MTKYLLVFAFVLFPFVSSAAIYDYVNNAGAVVSVQASSAEEALRIARDIALHSGVAINRGIIDQGVYVSAVTGYNTFTGTGGADTYYYVTTSGAIATVRANNPEAALMLAVNLALHSGVAINDGSFQLGTYIPNVI